MVTYIIIDNRQDIPLADLEWNLKNVSKKYRTQLYRNGDFLAGVNEKGYFIFITVENDVNNLSDEIINELTNNDIIAYSATEDELKITDKNILNSHRLWFFSALTAHLGEEFYTPDWKTINYQKIKENKKKFYLLLEPNQNITFDELVAKLNIVNQKKFDNSMENIVQNIYEDGFHVIYNSTNKKEINEIKEQLLPIKTNIVDYSELIKLQDEWLIISPNQIRKLIQNKFPFITDDHLNNCEFDELYSLRFENHEEFLDFFELTNNSLINNDIRNYLTIDRMHEFDNYFNNRIIGQEVPIEKVKNQLINKAYEYQMESNDNRPAGIFFFAGPTGVGKTETCKVLNQFLYNHENINRFDMSEYKNDVSINKLIGADHGFVGFEEGGVLINALRKNPNSVLLFDEIEKADRTIFDIFLQMFDEGHITSNKGEKFFLKNNFIVLTSNIGASEIEENDNYQMVEEKIKESVDYFFSYELNRPEILGRIGKDNIIVFNIINDRENLYKILDIYFAKCHKNFNNNNTQLLFDNNQVYNAILKYVDIIKGARDIRNEFDRFAKCFNKALYENKWSLNDIKNKTISFAYDGQNVYIELYQSN